jgi:hypothetical protein
MPYPYLLAWCLSVFTVFFNGLILDLAITPLTVTMIQTHLHWNYAWTLARQLPDSASSSSAFYPRFSLLVATQQTKGYAFTSALEGWDLPHGGSPINVTSCHQLPEQLG